MPSYSRFIVYSLLTFYLTGCYSVNTTQQQVSQENLIKKDFKYKEFEQEDKYIMFALESDRQGYKKDARQLYKELFDETLKEEYLLEFAKLSFYLKQYDDVINIVEKNTQNIENKIVDIKKIYILALMQKNDLDKALEQINELLKLEDNDKNYELLANVYIQKGQFLEAKKLYEENYKKNLDENFIVGLTNVMFLYLNEKKDAINLLESHVKMSGCNETTCTKLLSFYEEEKNVNGIISVLKRMYFKSKEDDSTFNEERVYKLLMFYLERKGVNDAIAFLEESGADDIKLLNLYRSIDGYDKAYALVQKLYSQTSNIDYLAQIAMIEFEMAKDKKAVLDKVIKKFEDVLIVLDNDVYQNYLGYILIDFDIDVLRGMTLVKKALEKAPNNLAYIDSLAWAQYKLKDCKNAYINMKKVVDSAGLKDKEIKEHWEKIKECIK